MLTAPLFSLHFLPPFSVCSSIALLLHIHVHIVTNGGEKCRLGKGKIILARIFYFVHGLVCFVYQFIHGCAFFGED